MVWPASEKINLESQAVACDVYDGVFLCCPFSPRDVFDEILNLSESFSEGFSTYSSIQSHISGVFVKISRSETSL